MRPSTSSAASAAITCTSLTFAWPDGTPALDGLDLVVGPGRSGLVGRNGSGKSTLLRLIAGDLHPGSGRVTVTGEVGYLPQDLTLEIGQAVPDFLGIAEITEAIRAVEAGSVDQRHFDVIGDDWDIEQRAVAELGRLGLPADVLDRRMGQLSGGEVVQLGLTRLLLRRPGRAPARRADQQPRRGRPRATLRRRRVLEPHPARGQPRPRSCSSASTGSATCATAPSGGTAAATRRTPNRSPPSRSRLSRW